MMRTLFLFAAALASLRLFAAPAVTEVQYLSGRGADDAQLWDFYCTAGRNSGVWAQIPVPSCWEVQGFGTYDYGVEFLGSKRLPERPPPPEEKGIYRRTFNVPAEWKQRVVRIVFEGVLTDAEVKINGESAGPLHQGGFYRFHRDITALLRFGAENTVEVTVGKRSANASVNAAERYADYWNFGGIFRPVWIEARPTVSIERVAIDARADGSFHADVFFSRPVPAGHALLAMVTPAKFRDRDAGQIGDYLRTEIPANASRVSLTGKFDSVRTWSAETPELYTVQIALRRHEANESVHVHSERFGFRTVEFRAGDGFYVNGRKVTFKGVNRGSMNSATGRTLSPRLNREDVARMKEANINAVRCSHYPPDPEFLQQCDEAGLYVLNELGGWHGHYDTPTGARLVQAMVARDVNHPSVIGWNNGNEGGSNPDLDAEFERHDPQRRLVLHPWEKSFRGLNTQHYREYAETQRFAAGPDVFMPTEFLHGLFDGGGGAGLEDYWKILGERPLAAGGFLWAWSEEAVARSDLGGRIDANRDLGPDGMIGPNGEKSGSFHAVRDLWCPVQIPLAELPADFAGELPVRNRHDFLNLSNVTFEWRLMKFAPPGALLFHRTLVAHGRRRGPDLAARAEGKLALPLPADWRDSDVLYLTAIDSRDRELWTWSWRWKSGAAVVGFAKEEPGTVELATSDREITVSAGRNRAVFDRATGQLRSLARDGRTVSLGGGPRLVAYRRNDRTLEPVAPATSRLVDFQVAREGDAAVLTARHEGALRETSWRIGPDGDMRLDYRIAGPGTVDLLGIEFDYPEEKMKSKEWFGAGPFRVWQNRLRGTQLARWSFPYNDPIPGFTWDHAPEFKGWFSRWEWIAFTTTEGRFAFLNDGGQPFVGVYAPRDGLNNPVLVLPRLGLGVYQAIPAIGTKQSQPSNLGPQGEPGQFDGPIKGSLIIRLLDQP